MLRLIPLIVAMILALPALAQTRHALVVGIDSYAHIVPLQRAVNDARAVAAALTEAGFRVDLQVNADEDALATAISDLAMRARQNDEVLVYFAGHGIEIGGQNYLLPADIQALEQGQEMLIRRDSIPVSDIIEALNERRVRISLLILDACRNNPFPQQGGRSVGGSRGLARVEGPVGTFVLFSAGTGQVAWDQLAAGDPDPNSVFTRVLLPRLRQPGLGVRAMVLEVRSEVSRLARSAGLEQFPAYNDQFNGDFVIRPTAVSAVAAPAPAVPPTAALTPAEMTSLGNDYEQGRRVEQSATLAAQWYRAAAEAGNAPGMRNLGIMYEQGRGVAQSDTEAVRWYRAAAEAGDATAMTRLANMHAQRRGGAGLYSTREAVRWYRAAAEAGDPEGMYFFGRRYAGWSGGVAQSDHEAVRWMRAAADAGEARAMYELGNWYFSGVLGLAQDDNEAFRWHLAAAEAGDAGGMASLVLAYNDGRVVVQDPSRAAGWFLATAAGEEIRDDPDDSLEYLGQRFILSSFISLETIEAVHRLLRDAGHYHGALDASWGPASEAALDAYVMER